MQFAQARRCQKSGGESRMDSHMQRLRIAFVTTYDSDNVEAWSGCGYYIRRALEHAGCEIIPVGNLRVPLAIKPLLKIKSLLYRKRKQVYHFDREPAVLGAYAAQVERAL